MTSTEKFLLDDPNAARLVTNVLSLFRGCTYPEIIKVLKAADFVARSTATVNFEGANRYINQIKDSAAKE